ncbi:hypothetical protein ACFL47_09190 [Candidatus Latescibacterota bacterium]
MSLALQAGKLGLYSHAMAGFKQPEAYKMLELPEDDYDLIAAVAVDYRGETSDLPENHKAREFPNDRILLMEMLYEGGFLRMK